MNAAKKRLLTICSVEHSSYYDRRMRQSPALIRARRPYLVKNAVLGLGITAVAVGVCTYRRGGRLPVVQKRGGETGGRVEDAGCQTLPAIYKHTANIADAYTITVVGQDDFSDVKVPTEPQPSAQTPAQQSQTQAQAQALGKK